MRRGANQSSLVRSKVVIIVSIIAFILRLISLNQSLWLDEAIQVWASRDFGIRGILFEYLKGDANPPLYHLLLHFWIKIFGDSEIAVRMPSMLLGTASVFLLYKISTSQVSALLLATSPLHLYYSQEARMYSLACFAVLLVVWRFLAWQKERNDKNSLFLATSLVLMGFSHYLTLLILPVIWIAVDRKYCKQLALINLPLIGLYLLYSPILFQQLKTGMEIKTAFPVWGKTVGSFSFKAAALLPVKFIIGRISMENKIIYGLISGVLVLIFWGIGALGAFKNFLIALLLILPPLFGFLISFWLPVFSYFRFIFVLPFFYLLIGLGAEKIKKKNLRKAVVIFLIGVNLACSFIYLFNPKFHREDWKGMVNWLHQQEKAPVLTLSQVSKPFEYYDRGERNLLFWPRDQEKIEENDKIWLVEYALPIFDPEKVVKGRLLEQKFVLVEQKSFREIVLSFWRKEIYAYRY